MGWIGPPVATVRTAIELGVMSELCQISTHVRDDSGRAARRLQFESRVMGWIGPPVATVRTAIELRIMSELCQISTHVRDEFGRAARRLLSSHG
jgi:hypothetical protein